MAIKVKTDQIMRETTERLDSFINLLTGQGDSLSDKGSAWDVQAVTRLSMTQLKRAYRGSYYAKRIVDLLAQDAVVRGWRVTDPGNPYAAEDIRWERENARLGISQALVKAIQFARAYGTGYIVPITYDLQPLNKPLDTSLLYEVQDLIVLDPSECLPQTFWVEDTPATRITEPAAFRLNAGAIHAGNFKGRWGRALSGSVDVHPTRVIPIIGENLSVFERLNHPFALGESVLQASWLAIARADGVDAAGAVLAQELKQDVVRIPDLKAVGTSDARAAFQLRMRLLKLSKSLLGMIVLGGGEEFESRATSVQGFRDLSQNARDALVATSGYPEAILFGKSTSGLTTAPGTEQEAYYRRVGTVQHQDIEPTLHRLYELIACAKLGAFGGNKKYRTVMIKFNPLSQESLKDGEARKLIQAQRDSIHAGMIAANDPSLGQAFSRYLAASRYGENGWQDTLPPFNPSDWMDPEPELEPEPEPEAATPPENDEQPKPSAPDGQTPSTKLPPGKAPSIGAQGVDIQPINTGRGQFDRADSQGCLTEWVQIDAEVYQGDVVDLPSRVRENARLLLVWKQKYPYVASCFDETEWRRVRQFVDRTQVGEMTVRRMLDLADLRPEYEAGRHRARSTKKPWKEKAILRWMSWGGAAGLAWALEKELEV